MLGQHLIKSLAYYYKPAYLQRCDFALNERHYKSDKYPEIVPFFPLKNYSNGGKGAYTLMIATPPITLLPLVQRNEERMTIFHWKEDIKSILKQVKSQYQQ